MRAVTFSVHEGEPKPGDDEDAVGKAALRRVAGRGLGHRGGHRFTPRIDQAPLVSPVPSSSQGRCQNT